jgi:tRNA modification GTPase
MAETIYALASGAGRAGIAVIRISGPGADTALAALGGDAGAIPRKARRIRLRDPADGTALDDGLALRFPGPRSYTGEDVVELYVHGGPAVVAAVLDALGRQVGLRIAAPWEFTRRAVLGGKMDLTEAEGLLDLIEAETEAQRRQALRQADGALGALYKGWRRRLVTALAHIEAVIDFPEEELPDETETHLRRDMVELRDAMAAHLEDGGRGERLRHGVQVAIVGPPNAGKSSLLNVLAQREAAIVAATAGTTRDVIEVRLDLSGYPVLMADTAGIRAAGDAVEAEGVRRAEQWAGAADLRVAVFAVDVAPEARKEAERLVDDDTLVVLNKTDLGQFSWRPTRPCLGVFPVSVRTGDGIAALLEALGNAVRDRAHIGTAPMITRARHREAVAKAAMALDRAGAAELPELAAEDLRIAARCLGRLTGAIDIEELLDVIFRDFCIGK